MIETVALGSSSVELTERGSIGSMRTGRRLVCMLVVCIGGHALEELCVLLKPELVVRGYTGG